MTRRWILAVTVAVAVAFGATACGGEAADGPPEIEFGRDVCDECHMIISEARYASAYRDREGNPYIFDDIGDMVGHIRRAGLEEGDVTAWVHDYLTEEWVDAPAAWFVRSDTLTTPMDGGVVAFTSRSDADAFIGEQGGDALRWPEVLAGAVTSGSGHDTTGPQSTDSTETTDREDQP